MAATIIDVARLCGYSKTTVSRAFIAPESVSEKAREKIYTAAQKINYTPNAIARAMVRQQTENIAFIIHEKQYPAILNPFYSAIVEAAIQESTKRNYSLFIASSQDMRLPNGQFYIKKHMDGVIFAGEANALVIENFRKQGIPVVLLNNYLEMEGLLCVTADHFNGAVTAMEHLYQRGHRRIGLLAGQFSKQVTDARFNGYLHVLSGHDLPLDTRLIREIDPTLEASEAAMTQLLALPDRPTAVFCTNDTIAAGACKAMVRAGLRIPEDMAVVGFDDSFISRVVEPGLTTIRIDAGEMGSIATKKLFDLIDGKGISETEINIPTELIVRGTT